MPARRDIWTGRYEFPWRGWGPLEDGEPTLPGLLSAAGIRTQLVTDHYHLWESGSGNYHFPFDGATFIRGQENDHWLAGDPPPFEYPDDPSRIAGHTRHRNSYERYLRNVAGRTAESDYFAAQVMQTAVNWLEDGAGEGPFFLLIDCFDPHEPFDPPPDDAERFLAGIDGKRNPWPTYGDAGYLSAEDLAAVRGLYAGEVAYVDRWVGRLLEAVERLGLADSTLVMVLSDHGHLLGEHGLVGKPWAGLADSNLYDELARIPFLVRHPDGHGAGRRYDELVQPIDVFSTLLDWFGVEAPPDRHGASVLPLLDGTPIPWREHAFSAKFGESVAVTDGRWTLFQWPPGQENEPLYWYSTHPPVFLGARATGPLEGNHRFPAANARGSEHTALYDRAIDPGFRTNLVAGAPEEAARLAEALRDFLTGLSAPPEQLRRLGIDAEVPESEDGP